MLIIITPPHALPDEERCIVNKLFESGLHLLHLRKPGADRETLERYIRGYPTTFPGACYPARPLRTGGRIRVKRDSLEIQRGTDVHRAESIAHVSASCHSFEEIDALPFEPNYVFFSARYLTASPNPDTRRLSPRNT